MNATHTHQEIAEQAYLLYQARGMMPGEDLSDWLEAERLLMQRSEQAPNSEATPPPPDGAHARSSTPFRRPAETGKDLPKEKKGRGGRDDVRTKLPHPAARLTLDRASSARGAR
jgi:hypothetical protein